MALRLTVILLLVMFVAMRFGGRDVANGPFAEQPDESPETALLGVQPLEEPLRAPEKSTESFSSAFDDEPEPEEDPVARATPTPDTPSEEDSPPPVLDGETALNALDLAVIDALGTRDSLGSGGSGTAPAETPVPTLPATPAETGVDMAEVTGTRVNLRSGPSTGNAVVGQASAGDRVEWVAEAAPGWVQIRHPDIDGEAYMSSNYLRRIAN